MVLKIGGMKQLDSEMAVSGYFSEPHGDPAEIPESTQKVLYDCSVRITLKLDSKKIDDHRG